MLKRLLMAGLALLVVAYGGGCGPSGPSATVGGEAKLRAAEPVVVIEFEGTLEVAGNDDMGANLTARWPDSSGEFERAGLEEFHQDVWLDGEWIREEPGHRLGVPLSRGPNTVRFRWTFTLQDSQSEARFPIEAEMWPFFLGGGEQGPDSRDVVSLTLRIREVTPSGAVTITD